MKTNQQGSATVILLAVVIVALLGAVGYMYYTNMTKPSDDVKKDNTPVASQTPAPSSTPSLTLHQPADLTYTSTKGVKIQLYEPVAEQVIVSPLQVVGRVPGNWSSEGVFPVEVTDNDGKVVATAQAKLDGDWMTDKPVYFTASVKYDTLPVSTIGFLVLKKDNPSGLAKNDDSLKIPIKFTER